MTSQKLHNLLIKTAISIVIPPPSHGFFHYLEILQSHWGHPSSHSYTLPLEGIPERDVQKVRGDC